LSVGLRWEICRTATTGLSPIGLFLSPGHPRMKAFAFKLVSAHPITCRCLLSLSLFNFKPLLGGAFQMVPVLCLLCLLTFRLFAFFCSAINTTNFLSSFSTAAKKELKPKKMIKNCFREFFFFLRKLQKRKKSIFVVTDLSTSFNKQRHLKCGDDGDDDAGLPHKPPKQARASIPFPFPTLVLSLRSSLSFLHSVLPFALHGRLNIRRALC